MAAKWDGKGKPPSRAAAVEWVMAQMDVSREDAKKVVGETGTLTAVGERARDAVFEVVVNKVSKSQVVLNYDLIQGAKTGSFQRTAQVPKSKPGVVRPTRGEERATDTDKDGRISSEEILEQAGSDEDILGDMPGATEVGLRGAALLPAPISPEAAAELRVPNQMRVTRPQRFDRDSTGTMEAPVGGTTGIRYYEDDLPTPLSWSVERRADLQRVMASIGLYGDSKVQLGSWTSTDTDLWAALLERANVNGLTWHAQLAAWKKAPPEDILDAVNGGAGGKRAPLVVRQTNPLDIAQTAEEVSRGLIGRVDRDFAEGTVAPYQGIEAATQRAAYDAEETGGTVTDAPSVQAFAVDQLRRTDAPEVDSYATLGAFNEMLRELGLAG